MGVLSLPMGIRLVQPEPAQSVDPATKQELTMRLIHFPLAAAVFYLGLNVGIAPAQQSQGLDPIKSQQGGKEEPGSHSSGANTQVFVNGQLAVPGAPTDTQTAPAKFSERNAKLDKIPIMARSLGLSDEQKRSIADSVGKSDAPVSQMSAKPADILPANTPVSEFSADLKASVPMMGNLHFIRTSDKILLVRSPNMVVTGEIAVN